MIVLEVHSTLQTVAFTGDICDPRFGDQTRVSLILTPPSQGKKNKNSVKVSVREKVQLQLDFKKSQRGLE